MAPKRNPKKKKTGGMQNMPLSPFATADPSANSNYPTPATLNPPPLASNSNSNSLTNPPPITRAQNINAMFPRGELLRDLMDDIRPGVVPYLQWFAENENALHAYIDEYKAATTKPERKNKIKKLFIQKYIEYLNTQPRQRVLEAVLGVDQKVKMN